VSSEGKTILLTGFPSSDLARRVLKRTLETDTDAEIIALTPEKLMDEAVSFRERLSTSEQPRVEIRRGDTADMDFGLSGKDFLELANQVNTIHHCAFVAHSGIDRRWAERINIEGTGEVLELARAASHLKQMVFWSTALVSATREGIVYEDTLPKPPSFRSVVEETRFRAEKLIRDTASDLPLTILRPTAFVGDQRTGEIDHFDGPYLLILLLLNAPLDFKIPLPKRGTIPLHVVPISYVVEAGLCIAQDSRALGRTFHIVDQQPMLVSEVIETIAKATDRQCEIGELPTGIATTLLRTPGLNRIAEMPRAFIEQIATDVRYDDRNSREILRGREITCPPLGDYLEVLIEYARSQQGKA
jgi:thioester reductase-like protein